MREENAPEENITKMIEIYHGEMIHRVTWMLAEYLNTPAKVEKGVASIITASSSLHAEVSGDALGNVAPSLNREAIGEQRGVSHPVLDLCEDHLAPAPEMKSSPGMIAHIKTREQEWLGPCEELVDAEEPSKACQPHQIQLSDLMEHHNKRVSPMWRWHVDPRNLSSDAVAKAFKRPSDLFAFHALPIARDMLASNSSRKETRHKIQNMLESLPNSEYDKWIESLQKLNKGDDTMLIRIPSETPSHGPRATAATPAPVDMQSRKTNASRPHRELRQTPDTSHVRGNDVSDVDLKPRDWQQKDMFASNGVAKTTVAFRHLSTEERGSRLNVRNVEPTHGAQAEVTTVPTPIMDLLCETKIFQEEDHKTMVASVMSNLTKRVPDNVSRPALKLVLLSTDIPQTVGICRLDGSIVIQEKNKLQGELGGGSSTSPASMSSGMQLNRSWGLGLWRTSLLSLNSRPVHSFSSTY